MSGSLIHATPGRKTMDPFDSKHRLGGPADVDESKGGEGEAKRERERERGTSSRGEAK